MTRLIYAFFLLLGVAVACIMLMPGMEGQLKKVRSVPDIKLALEYLLQHRDVTSYENTLMDILVC